MLKLYMSSFLGERLPKPTKYVLLHRFFLGALVFSLYQTKNDYFLTTTLCVISARIWQLLGKMFFFFFHYISIFFGSVNKTSLKFLSKFHLKARSTNRSLIKCHLGPPLNDTLSVIFFIWGCLKRCISHLEIRELFQFLDLQSQKLRF